jgi:CheY-like chemotaxis protein
MVYSEPTVRLIDGANTPRLRYSLARMDHHQDTNSHPNSRPVTQRLEKTAGGESLVENTKRILLIDDDVDSCFTIRSCLETYFKNELDLLGTALQINTFTDPQEALRQFKPYYYDLMLVDVNMPNINGYELVEKIVGLDLNIKVCFMTAGEINYEAITEIRHPARSFGCFIKKPAANDYLINRVMQELY